MSATAQAGQCDSQGYYARLGVAPGASEAEIRRAYRRAAKRWHPDRNRSPDAPKRMAELNEAYRVLGDPGQRAAYDRGSLDGERSERRPPRPVVSPPQLLFGPLCLGAREAHSVVVANAGGPCSTVRVEPESESWFALVGAQGGSAPGILAQLSFEAFADPGLLLSPGLHEATVEILLDGERAQLVLALQVVGAPEGTPAGSGSRGYDTPPLTDPMARPTPSPGSRVIDYIERRPLWKRIALAAAGGILALYLLLAGVGPLEGGSAGLAALAGLFALLSVYGAAATRLFTRAADASPSGRWAAAAAIWLGKTTLVLAAVATAVYVLLALLLTLLVLAAAALVVAALAGACSR